MEMTCFEPTSNEFYVKVRWMDELVGIPFEPHLMTSM